MSLLVAAAKLRKQIGIDHRGQKHAVKIHLAFRVISPNVQITRCACDCGSMIRTEGNCIAASFFKLGAFRYRVVFADNVFGQNGIAQRVDSFEDFVTGFQ